jgi:hypothetical protein
VGDTAVQQSVQPDDVFYITLDGAPAVLRDGEDRRALVTRRGGEWAFIPEPRAADVRHAAWPAAPLDALPPTQDS